MNRTRRRRDPAKEQFWWEALVRHRAGGLGIRAFCAREGLPESSFYAWKSELKRRDTDVATALRHNAYSENIFASSIAARCRADSEIDIWFWCETIRQFHCELANAERNEFARQLIFRGPARTPTVEGGDQ
jgi:hypothetical protein